MNKKVFQLHRDLILPKLSASDFWHKAASKGGGVVSTSFTPETLIKVAKLKEKYGISRSAIIRILIDKAYEEIVGTEKKVEEQVDNYYML